MQTPLKLDLQLQEISFLILRLLQLPQPLRLLIQLLLQLLRIPFRLHHCLNLILQPTDLNTLLLHYDLQTFLILFGFLNPHILLLECFLENSDFLEGIQAHVVVEEDLFVESLNVFLQLGVLCLELLFGVGKFLIL